MSNKLFRSVNVIGSLNAHEKVELALYIEDPKLLESINPFDYDEIDVTGVFTSPSGHVIKLPAFWYQDYDILLDPSYTGEIEELHGSASTSLLEPQGKETVHFKGEPHYRFRVLLEEAGQYTYEIRVNIKGELVQVLKGYLSVLPTDRINRGRLAVEPRHRRNFIFADGTQFIPIGQNVCWYTSNARKTYDYDVWFKKMHDHGMNATRIWMAPWGFSLHWNKPLGLLDLESAARLDRVVSLAERYDLYFMLTLLNHGQFSAKVNPQWDHNPWNKKNGGILDYPMEFFTSEEAKGIYKNQLRYIIARWSYSNHVMAWELWNEVSWVDDYLESDAGYKWHEEMANFVKSIDPYNHMVTTSFHNEDNEANGIEALDFANPHTYNYTDLNLNLTLPLKLDELWNKYHKPIFHSEIGINWRSGHATADEDPKGISLHQQCWAGMMGGGAGSAMNWWWDSFVHPNNHYERFMGASRFSKRMDLIGETYRQLRLDKGIKMNRNDIGILGYRIDNRIYGYLYDHEWKYNGPEVDRKDLVIEIPFMNGEYTVEYYDTVTGERTKCEVLQVSVETITLTVNSFHQDLAFIIK